MFLTVDGPNDVGKTSLVRTLAERLGEGGRSVTRLRQPSDSELGNFARSGEHHLVGMALAVLVVADRYVQIEKVIKPALAAGDIVVCDRYVASTLALQRLDDMEFDLLWQLNADALVPDLSVFLAASAETITQRLARRASLSRFERLPAVAQRELGYFLEAQRFLEQLGWPVLAIETENCSPELMADAVVARLAELNRI